MDFRVVSSPRRRDIVTIHHNIIILCCNNKNVRTRVIGITSVQRSSVCLINVAGNVRSERENGVVRKRRSANCFRHADRSQESRAKASTLRRSLQASYIMYLCMHLTTCTQNKYYMYIMRARLPSSFGQCVRKSRPWIIRSQK